MISLRQHAVSIAAVFLALALGVVLGSTSLSERLLSNVTTAQSTMTDQVGALRTDRDTLRARLTNAERFGKRIGPLALRDQLRDRSVVLMSTPDVPPAERAAMRHALGSAGALVTGELILNDGLVGLERADQLRSVATAHVPDGERLASATDPGRLAGGLLSALTLLSPETGEPRMAPPEHGAALAALADGGFVAPVGEVRPAALALILTGTKPTDGPPTDRAVAFARFAAQLDQAGAGAVLAGRTGAAEGRAAVATVRADASLTPIVSTVDNADGITGRVATVLALREQWERGAGHYGVAGSADDVVPHVGG